MKVCVIGDSGLLGQALVRKLAGRHSVLGISTSGPGVLMNGNYRHQACDVIRETSLLKDAIHDHKPRLVINCAGLADVAQCEKNPDLALALNARFPAVLAELASREGSDLIHISTDQVFDGKKNSPYVEEDDTHPTHQYGITKRKGEMEVSRIFPKALIVRTNIVGFRDIAGKPTFADWLCDALND